LASFAFKTIGNTGAASALTLSLDPFNTGFVAPGAQKISDVSFISSQIQVVPASVPAAIWLFGSALVGLVKLGRRKST